MEPLENQDLTDQELDGMLRQWQTPPAPGRMRAAVFPERGAPWWRWSIRIPLPAAACLVVLLAAGAWRWAVPDERVVTRVVYRDNAAGVLTFRELQPVTELRPRIIRRGHAEN